MTVSNQQNDHISWFARFFLLRTTFGVLLSALLALGGLAAITLFVKESYPDLSIPQATVSTEWPGADPQTIEKDVTRKIEKKLKTLAGLKTITSASFDSFSVIAVEFDADAEINEAMQLLRARVRDAETDLPIGVKAPKIDKVSINDSPIVSFALYGDVSKTVLSRWAKLLEERVERLKGVSKADVGGMRKEVVSIQLRPDRALALEVSPTSVRDALSAANIDMPWGEIRSDQIGTSLRFKARFDSVEDLRELPIARLGGLTQGRTVRLGEIAVVRRDLERETSRAFFSWDGSEFASAIEVAVKKSPGADTIAVIDSVKAELDASSSSPDWPVNLNYQLTQDESESIMQSLGGVMTNVMQAMLAVFVILFVLLTWREGLIVGFAIPVTFLGSLLVIWLLGYTLNQIVIIGIVLALGLLVDVFILMMEGMHEALYSEGKTFSQAALSTVKRYGLPAAAGQITTILALAPLMAFGGFSGKFIRILPVTAITCLVMSFIVAIFVAVPLSRFLLGSVGAADGGKETLADRITEKLSEKLRNWSAVTTLASRWRSAFVVGLALLGFIAATIAFSNVTMTMYEKADGVKCGITVELGPSTTLEQSQAVADRLGEVIRSKDYIESTMMLVGQKSPFVQVSLQDALIPTSGEQFIGFSCMFTPKESRSTPGYTLADRLRPELRRVLDETAAGASLELVPDTGQPNPMAPVQIALSGQDMGELRRISKQVQGVLRKVPGALDVRDNVGNIRSEIILLPRREAINFHGLTVEELGSQVRLSLGNDEVAKCDSGGLQDDLKLQLGMAWPSQGGQIGGPKTYEELELLHAYSPQGDAVPLQSLLRPVMGGSALSITHDGGNRSIKVMAGTSGTAASVIVDAVHPALEAMKGEWPPGYDYSFAGEAAEAADTFGSAGLVFGLGMILVFAVLILQFGSFRQSLIIGATIPLAVTGTFAGFYAFNMSFSFFAVVGLISLIGIVVNDAIVMIDTMNQHLRSGHSLTDAAARGAGDRLRPIVSTSLTTVVGLIPLAVSDPMWRPMCFAIIFGLSLATVMALVVVPCLFVLMTHEDHRAVPADGARS